MENTEAICKQCGLPVLPYNQLTQTQEDVCEHCLVASGVEEYADGSANQTDDDLNRQVAQLEQVLKEELDAL